MQETEITKTSIIKIIDEAQDIKTFVLKGNLKSKPGQFVMLWIPQLNQRPFSIYQDNDGEFALTIAKIGDFTSKLFEMKVGDHLGYSGPFGKPFVVKGENIALVGGGYGSAPLSFLANEALKKGIKSELIIGAKTKNKLLYIKKHYHSNINRHYCTDDGSFGFKGLTTQKLIELLKTKKINMVYTVGPELMMKKVVEICDKYNVDCQLSLERYMKCGYGICGTCCVDPIGIRMCVEGPCLDKELAKKITEFGKYHRDATGKKVHFKC